MYRIETRYYKSMHDLQNIQHAFKTNGSRTTMDDII